MVMRIAVINAIALTLLGWCCVITTAFTAPSSLCRRPNDVLRLHTFSKESMAGAVEPTGFFDPLDFAAKANLSTLKRYREAELVHGRVAMLAAVGFLAGEYVEGSSFLFNGQITGPAITHLGQVPAVFWVMLTIVIGAAEQVRLDKGWMDPADTPFDQPGLLKTDYVPGDLGFDPLGLKPSNPIAYLEMQTKELQNGRLAMLASAGFIAQELVNGKGILENLFG